VLVVDRGDFLQEDNGLQLPFQQIREVCPPAVKLSLKGIGALSEKLESAVGLGEIPVI
jgi:hypothetical protein